MTKTERQKHIPIRMCTICRERRPKSALSRFIPQQGASQPLADTLQILPGRGCYVCASDSCREKFIAKGARKCKGV